MLSHRPDDDVNMVCHHAPGTEVITITIEMHQRIANDGSDLRAFHQTGSVPGIQRFIHALVVMLVEFALQFGSCERVACILSLLNAREKFLFFGLVLFENVSRQ